MKINPEKIFRQKWVSTLVIAVSLSTLVASAYFHNEISQVFDLKASSIKADLLNQESNADEKALQNYLPYKLNEEIRRSALYKIFPIDFDRTVILSYLEMISLRNNVNIEKIDFSDEIAKETYRVLPFDLQLEGQRENLISFLSSIDSQIKFTDYPIVNIIDLNLEQKETDKLASLLPEIGGDDKGAKWLIKLKAETYAHLSKLSEKTAE
ncbi:MAG: type 4a pilus biogenesis protein PilO [Patescibacteria group bacterium]|nr:type 4a pilus biogenesis protein PilO [Patescibacteria group bacterium]